MCLECILSQHSFDSVINLVAFSRQGHRLPTVLYYVSAFVPGQVTLARARQLLSHAGRADCPLCAKLGFPLALIPVDGGPSAKAIPKVWNHSPGQEDPRSSPRHPLNHYSLRTCHPLPSFESLFIAYQLNSTHQLPASDTLFSHSRTPTTCHASLCI